MILCYNCFVKPQITIDDFAKLDLRVGEVVTAEDVPGSEKLVKLTVDFKDQKRIIYAGIKKWYGPENLRGRKFIFVINLAPRVFKINNEEHTSDGMLIAAGDSQATLYTFDSDLENGTTVH